MDYSLGFMFSEDKSKVLLILKDRPQWQAGKLNGIGGKTDKSKDLYPKETQIREFYEETGIVTNTKDWEEFAIITGKETENKTGTELDSTYSIHCYRAFSDKIAEYKKMESESPLIVTVDQICLLNKYEGYLKTVPNVQWLVPMALYHSNSILNIQYN